MEVRVETLTSTSTVVTDRKVECVIVGERVVIYRLTVTTKVGNKEARTRVTEGITSRAGLFAFRRGAETLPEFQKNQAAILGTPEYVELLRTVGYTNDAMFRELRALRDDPYTRWLAGNSKVDDIIVFEGGDHRASSWDGTPLACAIHFDYIEARMSNKCYDLRKALAILRARPDIRFRSDKGENLTKEEARVMPIPGYNADAYSNKFLSFVWMPTQADYLKMLDQCAITKDTRPLLRDIFKAVFDADMLGLRAGGAALIDDFYKDRFYPEYER